MATNKRKTLQIKRPESVSSSKEKPVPKVPGKSQASAPETEKLQPVPETKAGKVPLPDSDKIRQARRADDTQDKLPGAEEVMEASKNATAQIMIDVEDVKSPQRDLASSSPGDDSDKTMKIDLSENQDDAAATSKIPLEDVQDMTQEATRVATNELPEIKDTDLEGAERTMKIDLDAVSTGDEGEVLEEAHVETPAVSSQQTEDTSEDQRSELMANETMMMDPADFEEQNKAFNAMTVALDPDEKENDKNTVSPDQMQESFNAMTMAMDPAELARELESSKETQQQPEGIQDSGDDEQRPKTILIKRPSREAPAGAPTVKTVRPDAQTVRTARPATPKEGTSRVDIPTGIITTEGKTVKLRRPAGATGSRPGAPVSRVAAEAGLDVKSDGSVSSSQKKNVPAMGAGWLAVSVVTFLVTCGALWISYSTKDASMPMIDRIVDENNVILPFNPPQP